MKKRLLILIAILAITFSLASCASNATVVSHNLSKEADQFKIERRIVFFNGVTDTYLMTVEGRCSIYSDNEDHQLEVTCKTGPNAYKKEFFGLSDNTAYFVQQIGSAHVSEYHYEVIFKPETIVPDIKAK